MEDVAAGQLLGGARGGGHLLPADDAHVVSVGELLGRGVRVEGVHVVNGAAGQHHVIERFLEGPHGEVHRADGEQGQGVDPDHDDEEENVEEDLDKADKQLGVEHEHGLVLPRILRVEVDRVEDILDHQVNHDGQQDGVLEPEHELDTGALGQGRGVGVLDKEHVEGGEDQGQGEDAEVEQEGDHRGALHVIHPVLGQPVE